jgi:tRNA-2-methylthio-N6-dimethylallyladenosine synthase
LGGTVYIRTLGCQMNVKDSERALGLLVEAGYAETPEPEAADVLLINTCSVREKPEQKVLGLLGEWQKIKRDRPEAVIGLMGCFAQQRGQALLDRSAHLSLIIGTHMIHRLPELVARARAGERIAAVELLPPDHPDLFRVSPASVSGPVSAFVSIQQGCDNHCAYCIVPSVRGGAVNRPAAEVLAEVRRMAGAGVREVTLLGQNVNAWRDGAERFPGLLRGAARVAGIERVRFTTSHPKDLDDGIIAAMAEEPQVMEHLHLPVQAGSDWVLQAMRRGYSRGHYLKLVRQLRDAMPGIGLTTDLIVGFPGETEKDFQDTLSLLAEVRYDESFSFRYCIRPGTAAAELPGQIPEYEKYDRLYRLQRLQRELTEEKNHEQVGRVHEILIEGPSKTDPGRQSGRTRGNRLVHFQNSRGHAGKLVKVTITQALKHSLVGEVLGPDAGRPCPRHEEETCISK